MTLTKLSRYKNQQKINIKISNFARYPLWLHQIIINRLNETHLLIDEIITTNKLENQ